MRNLSKREMNLERRLREKRETLTELMLENAQLKDRLALYEQYLGDQARLVTYEYNYPLSKDTIDIGIRFHPKQVITEVRTLEGGTPKYVDYHKLYGVLALAKDAICDGYKIGEDVEYDDDDEDEDFQEVD